MSENPKSRPHLKPYQFRPGQSGNPGGKTKQQVKLERENAERASNIRHMLLIAVEHAMKQHVVIPEGDDGTAYLRDPEKVLAMANGDVLRLLKDSEERGLGKPVQPFEVDAPKTDEEVDARIDTILQGMGFPEDLREAIRTGRARPN